MLTVETGAFLQDTVKKNCDNPAKIPINISAIKSYEFGLIKLLK